MMMNILTKFEEIYRAAFFRGMTLSKLSSFVEYQSGVIV